MVRTSTNATWFDAELHWLSNELPFTTANQVRRGMGAKRWYGIPRYAAACRRMTWRVAVESRSATIQEHAQSHHIQYLRILKQWNRTTQQLGARNDPARCTAIHAASRRTRIEQRIWDWYSTW